MKKMRSIPGFIMMIAVIFIANSCTESVPTYTTENWVGCNDVSKTHIKILVCDVTQLYFGGVEVFMYETEEARTNDPQRSNYYQKATTDNTDPQTIGAIFYKTPYKHFYFFARRDLGGGNFLTGVVDGFPTMCDTKAMVIVLQ